MGYEGHVLIDDIKARMTRAMRERDEVAKNVLGVALGEIQTAEARANRPLADDEAAAIVRKLVKSNEETLSLGGSHGGSSGSSGSSGSAGTPAGGDARASALEHEIQVLSALLPAALTPAQIERALAPVADAVRSAKSDGQAMGVAMKHLKATGASVEAAAVQQALKSLRG